MLRYLVRPLDPSFPSAEIIAHDAAPVLYQIERMNCREADVDRDGEYAFSASLQESGIWRIFQRNNVVSRILTSKAA